MEGSPATLNLRTEKRAVRIFGPTLYSAGLLIQTGGLPDRRSGGAGTHHRSLRAKWRISPGIPLQLRPDEYDVKSPFSMASSDEGAAYGTAGAAELQTGSLLRVTGLQFHLYNE